MSLLASLTVQVVWVAEDVHALLPNLHVVLIRLLELLAFCERWLLALLFANGTGWRWSLLANRLLLLLLVILLLACDDLLG